MSACKQYGVWGYVFRPSFIDHWVRIMFVSWQDNSEGISDWMMQHVFTAMAVLAPILPISNSSTNKHKYDAFLSQRDMEDVIKDIVLARIRWALKDGKWVVMATSRDRLPTRLHLAKKGIDTPFVLCPICEKEPESSAITHHAITVHEVFDWVDNLVINTRKKVVLDAIVCSLQLYICKFRRNDMVFSKKIKRSEIIEAIKDFLFVWVTDRNSKLKTSYFNWLQNPLNFL
ncbi:hypothetical protein LXL04_006004 [Taraxacum kok-saghyz]